MTSDNKQNQYLRLCREVNERIANEEKLTDLIEGHLDDVIGGYASGWLWSPKYPELKLSVSIFDNDEKLLQCEASDFRSDLEVAGKGRGDFAFSCKLPVSCDDGNEHQILAQMTGSEFFLRAEPLSYKRQVYCDVENTQLPSYLYTSRLDYSYRKSWKYDGELFINDAHREVVNLTDRIEGWLKPEDVFKLFEMGYFAGNLILEIGVFKGRSAAAALSGALSNTERQVPPVYYGVDIDRHALRDGSATLESFGLEPYSNFHLGCLESFYRYHSISPTMVFVDGDHSYEGVKKDIDVLSNHLKPNTPVLFHDYRWKVAVQQGQSSVVEVQKACDEWEASGRARFIGVFGCSSLYLTT